MHRWVLLLPILFVSANGFSSSWLTEEDPATLSRGRFLLADSGFGAATAIIVTGSTYCSLLDYFTSTHPLAHTLRFSLSKRRAFAKNYLVLLLAARLLALEYPLLPASLLIVYQ